MAFEVLADGGAVLDGVGGQGAQAGAAVELGVGGAVAELAAQRLGALTMSAFSWPIAFVRPITAPCRADSKTAGKATQRSAATIRQAKIGPVWA